MEKYEILDYFRLVNIFIAVLALTMNLLKGYYLKLHKTMGLDSSMGFLALMAWCLGYAISGTIAAFADLDTGPWTVVMAAPIIWTLIAGLIGWDKIQRKE